MPESPSKGSRESPRKFSRESPRKGSRESPRKGELYRFDSRRPAEVEEPPVDSEEWRLFRAATDLREPYRINRAYLEGAKKFTAPEISEAPLIVFINSKSGGHAGPRLTEVLYQSLGHAQVFDLQDYRPKDVLQKIWENFAKRQSLGDPLAAIMRERLKILAAGGDGTVAWILGTIKDLRLDPPPSVAIMPLGTGNDLSLSFGWGNAFLPAWINKRATVYETLKRVADAEVRDLDCWNISLTSDAEEGFEDLPHSLAAVDLAGQPGSKVQGKFWNYFSLGLDAEAAYNFHHLREEKPWAASSRLANQAWYSYFSCTTGWFCFPPPINAKAKVLVKGRGETEWVEVVVKKDVKALVLLNLQSYAGGRDLWGLKDHKKDEQKGWKNPIFNDGLIEVVGLLGGYHTAAVMGGVNKNVHAKRLAQASEVLVILQADGKVTDDHGIVHMQLDGEPWPQIIPVGNTDPVTVSPWTPPCPPSAGRHPSSIHFRCQVHIRKNGVSKMLYNPIRLRGIAPKISKLAVREGQESLKTDRAQPPISIVPQTRAVSDPKALQRVSTGQEAELRAVARDSPGHVEGLQEASQALPPMAEKSKVADMQQ